MLASLASNRIDSSSHRLSVLTSQRLAAQQPAVGQVAAIPKPACIAELEMQEDLDVIYYRL